MSPQAQKFIKLQRQVNEQFNNHGIADSKLVDELDRLGCSLTNDEINEVCDYYNPPIDLDDEWMDEMAAHTTQMDKWLAGE